MNFTAEDHIRLLNAAKKHNIDDLFGLLILHFVVKNCIAYRYKTRKNTTWSCSVQMPGYGTGPKMDNWTNVTVFK